MGRLIKEPLQNKKGLQHVILFFLLVARPGFEPRHSDPETEVLPLYYRAERGQK
jgi:hypothetical protein